MTPGWLKWKLRLRQSRCRVSGYPLAVALARTYSQAWYPEPEALTLFVDRHIKPHWTKYPAHSGHVTMWGQAMPGTKQLMLNGPEGHLLGNRNMAIDRHLNQVLVDLEADLEQVLQRLVAYTVCDSDAGGLPVGQRYAEAEQFSLSRLAQSGYTLDDFEVLGDWQPVMRWSWSLIATPSTNRRWRKRVSASTPPTSAGVMGGYFVSTWPQLLNSSCAVIKVQSKVMLVPTRRRGRSTFGKPHADWWHPQFRSQL